jgi:hypothetical protein
VTTAFPSRSWRDLLAPRLAWGLATAAVIGLAVLATFSLALRLQLDERERTVALWRHALAAAAQPGAQVALLRGSAEAPEVSGLAVVTEDGGTIVLEGLTAAPSGHYYEAWYLSASTPRSAGRLDVQPGGTGLLSGLFDGGPVDQIAVTLEPVDGGPGPDGPLYAVGTVSANPS